MGPSMEPRMEPSFKEPIIDPVPGADQGAPEALDLIDALPELAEEKEGEYKDIHGEIPKDHEQIRQFHISKLRAPHFSAFFEYLRHSPGWWDKLKEAYERRTQFWLKGEEEAQRLRLLTPLFSTAVRIPELRSYLHVVLDGASREENELVRSEIESGSDYVPQLVIGAGVHGAVFNAEFLHDAPTIPSLTIEHREQVGGQFRSYGNPVLDMNSENAAINRSQTPGSMNVNTNTFGPHAPVQLPDLSAKLYADNEEIGLATAFNQYLSANTLTASVERVEKNDDTSRPGKYRVVMRNGPDETEIVLTTDQVAVASGIGTSDYGLRNPDQKTQEILSAEQEKNRQGENARVLTYEEFLQKVGDPTNQFPLEQFIDRKVVIVGGGHSGLTVAEYLSHLGPSYRGSVSSLGAPSEIVILGSKYTTRDELLNSELPRYSRLAAVMERKEKNPRSAEPLINLRPKTYVSRLREMYPNSSPNDPLEVGFQFKDGQLNPDGSPHMSQDFTDADYVIFTTGFSNTILEAFEELLPADHTIQKISALPMMQSPEEGNESFCRHIPNNPGIIFVGSVADMPLSERELELAQRYNMTLNPVAMANTTHDTVVAARHCAAHLAAERKSSKVSERELKIARDRMLLPDPASADSHAETVESYSFNLDEQNLVERFPTEMHYSDLLGILISSHGRHFRVAETSTINLTIERVSSEEGATITIRPDRTLPAAYGKLLEEISHDLLVQSLVHALTNPKERHSSSIQVPLTLKT